MAKRPTQRNVVIPEQQWSALGALAETTGRGTSEIIREFIAEGLARQQKALPTCSQCGNPAPVAGYCSKGPLCPECF